MVIKQEKKEKYDLVLLDTKSGKKEVKFTFSLAEGIRQLEYDAGSDTLYILCDNGIFTSRQFATEEKLMIYSAQQGKVQTVLVDGRWFVVFSPNGVHVLDVQNPVIEGQELVLMDFSSSWEAYGKAMATVQEEYPGITYVEKRYLDDYETTEAFVTDLLTNPAAFDVMAVHTGSFDLDILMEKGYCLDLSISPYLKSRAEQLYPAIYQAMVKDGQLFAMPYSALHSMWVIARAKGTDAAGLALEDLPVTYGQLLDMKKQQGDEPFGSEGRYTFGLNQHDGLLRCVLTGYGSGCQYLNQPIQFNTPDFKRVLEDVWEICHMAAPSERELVFSATGNRVMEGIPLSLKITPEDPALLRFAPEVLIVNAASPNKEAALRLVEETVKNLCDVNTLGTQTYGAWSRWLYFMRMHPRKAFLQTMCATKKRNWRKNRSWKRHLLLLRILRNNSSLMNGWKGQTSICKIWKNGSTLIQPRIWSVIKI